MTDKHFTDSLKILRECTPSDERVASLRVRVNNSLSSVHNAAPIKSPWMSSISVGLVAALFTIVLAFSLPTYNTYQDSVLAVSDIARASESLKGEVTVEKVDVVQARVATARQTLDALKLKGVPFSYTQAQCKNAYVLYETSLEELNNNLNEISVQDNPELQTKVATLRAYVTDSKEEAEARVEMYPK